MQLIIKQKSFFYDLLEKTFLCLNDIIISLTINWIIVVRGIVFDIFKMLWDHLQLRQLNSNFFRGGLRNDIKVNGRFELKLRVSNDHCLDYLSRETKMRVV